MVTSRSMLLPASGERFSPLLSVRRCSPDAAPSARKYSVECQFGLESFLRWGQDEVAKILVCKRIKVLNRTGIRIKKKEMEIPAAYVRLIDMFNKLEEHGLFDHSHEGQRRSSYAERMIEELGKELWSTSVVGKEFRSKVLNPVMQRHKLGIPADYTPTVERAVSRGRQPTIRDATRLYLEHDPVDPAAIHSYRRNVIYIPEARWHLGIMLGVIKIDNEEVFHDFHTNTDTMILDRKTNPPNPIEHNSQGVPAYTRIETEVIINEGLEVFFKDELGIDVGLPFGRVVHH